jgi:hypothetical protein
VKRTTGPKDQQCTDLSPLSLWLARRSLDEGGTGGDTRPTETRTAARIFNIQFSIFNREWNENVKENVKFHVSPLGLIRDETLTPETSWRPTETERC